MGNLKKWKALVLSLCMVISVLLGGTTEVYADNAYSNKELILLSSEMTIYTNQTSQQKLVLDTWSSSTEQKVDGEMLNKKILNDLVCTSSDKSVVGFDTGNEITGKIKPKGLRIPMMGVSEGTATITVKSKLLNQTLKFKVTVKDAELACEDAVYYTGNKYTFAMKGNAKGVSYSSSNKSVAVINKKTGVVRAKKAGTTTIACVADNGKTYTYKMKVKKSGLSYTKLTTYYYTGVREGIYHSFPLVAAGIDVKSWSSTNKKVCTVENLGRVGVLNMVGTGKTTITCTSKSGKKYTCKLTVAGGKIWGGFDNGYHPTLSTLKKHGYFKDINTVKDYGDVVVAIVEYDHEIKLGNGNKPLTIDDAFNAMYILQSRYPNASVELACGGDHLCFTSNDGKKIGRIHYMCYYAKPVEMKMKMELESPMTIYTNVISSKFVSISGTAHSGYEDDYSAMMEKIQKDIVCTSSDESVVSVVTEQEILNRMYGKITLQDGCYITLRGVSPGTATITVKSNILNQTLKVKVTVKDAGL